MQNFNSLGCLVLEISAFQYEACNGLRAGASVHKLFVGGVYSVLTLISAWVSNNFHVTVLVEIIYPYLIFNGITVDV